MKHLHFVQSVEPLEGGGLGRAALELSSALNFLGSTSRLVATGSVCFESTQGDLLCYERLGPTRAFYSPGMHRDAEELVLSCDCVHGHGFYVAPNWLLGSRARRHRRPFVYHPHGMFEPWILARSRWKKRIAHFLFENANFRYASIWRALTNKEADQIRRQGIGAQVIVCPNGIDLLAFDPVPMRRRAISKERKVLLFLARLHPKKGLPLLVEAWGRVPVSLRSSWCVVVAGPDELSHRAEVEALIHDARLEGDIRFVGPVSGDAKLDVLASADAFVLPSHSEGFSMAILEALACRLPVIATHACNFPEVAESGGGWCVSDEADSLSRAICELLEESNEGLRQRGESGRRLVESRYTWEQVARDLTAACERVRTQ